MILKTPSTEQRELLSRLMFSKDGAGLLAYLKEASAQNATRLEIDEDVHRVRMYQGVGRALHDLIDLLNPVST